MKFKSNKGWYDLKIL